MARRAREQRLTGQLKLLLSLSGAHPARWMVAVLAASVVLAALDTVGVAAMVPLTQLLSGASTESGILGTIASLFGTGDPAILIPAVAGTIAAVFLIKSVAAVLFRWWLLGRTTRLSALVAADLLRRYLAAPYAAHRGRRLSEVYRNINDSTGQASSVLLSTLGVITDAIMLLAIVAVLAVTAPLVTLFTVLLFAAMVLGLQHSLRRLQARIGEEIAEAGMQAWGFLMPALDGFREARLTASEDAFITGFRGAKLRSAHAARQLAIVTELPRYALEIGFVIAIAGIAMLLFATGTAAEALTVLGVFAAASLRGLPTLNRVAGSLATIRTNRIGLRIVQNAIADLAAERSPQTDGDGDVRFSGDIQLKDVGYRYPGADRWVLRGISLTVPRNRTTAFVGSSGAGKTTLLDVVLGLLDPTEGSVESGGRSVHADRAAWYAGLGVVPQEVFLINDSLAANVAFGVAPADIDRDRVLEVLGTAQLSALVADLPDGLDTVMGERGVRLSGGQRQRLGLARALYRRPEVLVLDEATSALDNATEHEITETLSQLKGSLTILIVAHRLSTVRDADALVFLKDGSVAAQGTFAEVRQKDADFARLVALGQLQ